MKGVEFFIWTPRFDFGIPLEDVFPPSDIHPRLKFLFEESLVSGEDSGLTIQEILSIKQESLETRLRLKEILIYDESYKKNNYLPGTYLWLIRHFLGLLPISLIPEYSNKTKFEWKRFSDQCRDYLKYGRSFKEDSFFLNFLIVGRLTQLPREHLILLNYLIVFIRKMSKVSTSNVHQQKINLVTIANYFCGSIFVRPYRPGYNESALLPLLLYLLLKWHEILEILSDMGITTRNDTSTIINTDLIKKKVPFKFNKIIFSKEDGLLDIENVVYSKDIRSQIETISVFNKSSQTSKEIMVPFHKITLKDVYCQTDTVSVTNRKSQTIQQTVVDHFPRNADNQKNSPPLANSTAILSEIDTTETLKSTNNNEVTYFTAPDFTTKYYSFFNNSDSFVYDPRDKTVDNSLTAEESQVANTRNVSFFSAVDTGIDWNNIVEQVSSTVKKREEYFYDDYDTFTKEEFNQISNEKNHCAPGEDKSFTKLGLKRQIFKTGENLNNNLEIKEDNSYIKYDNVDDVFDVNNESFNQNIIKDNVSDLVIRSSFSSEEKLSNSWNVKSTLFKDTRSKLNFSLKRFKIKMNFWRLLTNKNTPTNSIMEGYFKSSKYERMKQSKANTM